MLTILFIILFFAVFGELLGIAMKACWEITKITLYFVAFPVILITLVVAGFVYLAIPILAIVGVFSMVKAIA